MLIQSLSNFVADHLLEAIFLFFYLLDFLFLLLPCLVMFLFVLFDQLEDVRVDLFILHDFLKKVVTHEELDVIQVAKELVRRLQESMRLGASKLLLKQLFQLIEPLLNRNLVLLVDLIQTVLQPLL